MKGSRLHPQSRPAGRIGRIPLEAKVAAEWKGAQRPGGRQVWEHGGHRFEVLDVRDSGIDSVVFLLARPLDDGPGRLEERCG